MTRLSGRCLLAAAVLAAAVFTVDAAAAGWWRRTAAIARVDAAAGVERLATGWALELPEAVRRGRRLSSRDLSTASAAELASALERLGRRQRTWFCADPSGFKNAARAALIEQRPAEGLVWLRAALRRDPTSPTLHRLTAYAFNLRGERERALDHLAEARGLASGTTSAALALTHEESRWVRGEGLWRALDLYPRQRVRTVIELARALRDDGFPSRGRAVLETELPHPEVELEIASWDREAGQLDRARERLMGLSRRTMLPSFLRARVWSQIAEVYDLEGRLSDAEAAAARALALDPDSPAPHLALAQLAERQGDFERSLKHLRSAWGLTPTDVRLLNRIASVAESTGNLADARLALERAVVIEPDSTVQAARLVDFRLRNGEYMAAAFDLGRFLDRFPTDPTLLRLADRLQQEVTR